MKERGKKETEKRVDHGDEVERLLEAAHDQVLLNLSVDSHLASSGGINSDLNRRFQALKSQPFLSSSSPSAPSPVLPPVEDGDELRAVLGDDLSARFAALKAKTSSSSNPILIMSNLKSKSTSESSSSTSTIPRIRTGVNERGTAVIDDEETEDDEVERLIQWAKDAARLDPSSASDEEEGFDDDDDNDFESSNTKKK